MPKQTKWNHREVMGARTISGHCKRRFLRSILTAIAPLQHPASMHMIPFAIRPTAHTRSRRRIPALLLAVSALISCHVIHGECRADTLVTKDGRERQGTVISDDGTTIVFEVGAHGATMRQRFSKDEVQHVRRDDTSGPSYYPLPIIGTIGKNDAGELFVTAESFARALDEVRAAKPDYVLLVIDSPGGSVDEMEGIVNVMASRSDLRFIAYVKRAISAAAIIAMACPEIYMAPDATIGAAVPYQVTPDGTPQNIDEKMRSAIRAGFRAAAELGGHSHLLVRGMMETDIALAVLETNGKPVVVEATSDVTGRMIKSKGRILTLTADESLECGLSLGTVGSLDEIKEHLGLSEWRMQGDRGWHVIQNSAKAEHSRDAENMRREAKRAAEENQQQLRIAEQERYIERTTPELSQIEARLAQITARRSAAEIVERELAEELDIQLLSLRDEYVQLENRARISNDPHYWMERVIAERDREERALRERYDVRLIECRRQQHEAVAEEVQLIARREKLLASVPVVK